LRDAPHFQPVQQFSEILCSTSKSVSAWGALVTQKFNPKENTNMKTGNGKIANLPAKIRDELNYRITDGEQGNELVEWLNSKPEVIRVIKERFDGTPISEQNLSEWRKRGYQKWLAHRNFVDESNALSDNSGDIAETGIDCDKLLLTLTAAYAEMIRNWIITPGEQMTYKLAVYKNLTNGVIALQRAELQKVRLEIARERLELLREKRCNKSGSSSAPALSSSEKACASKSDTKDQSETADAAHSRGSLSRAASPAPPAPPTPPQHCEPPESENHSRNGLNSIASGESPNTTKGASATGNPPTPPVPVAATSPKPVAPQDVPLWPSRRPGAPPRNASPRNPLGLL
jgi:hypothetical protein